MNEAVARLINEQINKEFYSAYLYLDFANYYAAAGLDGFENWYRVQAQEERDHALLFFQYLLNNGVAVSFGAIDAPDWTRGDHMTPLKKALEHEQYVTSLINGIYAAAYDDRDFRTMQLLDWFVKEQGEEEKNASDLITKMELFGADAKGLMLNSELKARVYAAPLARAVTETYSKTASVRSKQMRFCPIRARRRCACRPVSPSAAAARRRPP